MLSQTKEIPLNVGEIKTETGVKVMTLHEAVSKAIRNLFEEKNTEDLKELYDELVFNTAEKCLIDVTLEKCRGNQTKAARMLGINRGTLRKKIEKYLQNKNKLNK